MVAAIYVSFFFVVVLSVFITRKDMTQGDYRAKEKYYNG
jgi:hypothetical protein